jgi:hypothetical protein
VREERPVLQLPISAPQVTPPSEDEAEEEGVERGIALIDFYI